MLMEIYLNEGKAKKNNIDLGMSTDEFSCRMNNDICTIFDWSYKVRAIRVFDSGPII